MFEGEKTWLFWAGLLILSLASVILFAVIWNASYYEYSSGTFFLNNVPLIVGSIVFVLIGLYMMKSGVKDEKPKTET